MKLVHEYMNYYWTDQNNMYPIFKKIYSWYVYSNSNNYF